MLQSLVDHSLPPSPWFSQESEMRSNEDYLERERDQQREKLMEKQRHWHTKQNFYINQIESREPRTEKSKQ